jgi:hypothetical protein
MKRFLVLLTFVLLIVTVSNLKAEPVSREEVSEGSAEFTIARLVIAGSIEDREPFGVVDVFAVPTEKVYCFLEARDIKKDTTVSFVWYHGEKKMAKVDLPLKQGKRWRTYSSKKLFGLKGQWKVELQDANGNVLQVVEFKVEEE